MLVFGRPGKEASMVKADQNTGITRKLGEYVGGLTYEDLSPEAVTAAKNLLLDILGVAAKGSTTESARAAVQALAKAGRPGESVAAGTRHRFVPEYAALANGIAAHSLDFDDLSNESSLHPGAVILTTAMACGDLTHVDGKSFIAAVAGGYEVMVRLGRALKPAEHYARGFHPTGTCGAFGSAAVASRLLGLKEDAFLWSLGIAGSQTSGSLEFLAQGTWTKRFHPGWASHSGIIAALLAQEGFTGPTTIIEGRDGFLNAYSADSDPSLVLEDLGGQSLLERTSVKPHACCRYKHGAVDCVLELAQEHNLTASDIQKVRVGVLSAGFGIIAEPAEQKRNPSTVVDMQFSMPFGVAVAVLHGQAFFTEYAEGMAARPEVKEIMAKVECVTDPALDALYPRQWPAWVEITIKDSRTLKATTDYPKGDPENALTWDELKAKFSALSEDVFSAERQGEIISAVERLEDLSDIRELTQLLAKE